MTNTQWSNPRRDDPGTRQLDASVPRPVGPARAPVETLVQLGRREEERGRGPRLDHDHAIGKEAQ